MTRADDDVRHRQHPLARAIEVCESGLFAFFATLLTLMVLLGPGLMFVDGLRDGRLDRAGLVGVGVIIVAWLPLDAPLLWRIWRQVGRGPQPLAIRAALAQRRLPWPLRLPVALWWIAHFGIGVIAALMTEAIPAKKEAAGQNPEVVVLYFLVFTYTLAANGYLAQALRALGVGERGLTRFWAWRIAVDFAVMLASFTASATIARLMK